MSHSRVPEPDLPATVEEDALRPAETVPEAGMLGREVNRIGVLFAFAFVVSAAILILEIVLRYGFNRPTLWAHETTIFLCAVAFVFGGLYCAALDKHIRVVLIYDLVGPQARRVLDVAISLVCLVSTGFFAYAAWLMVARAWWMPGGAFRMETTGSAWNPPTPALLKAFLLIVLGVMALQFLILAYNYARRRP
jgi:C4-dicarboxylate transporter DctQ subunit